jgi:hypothetical protein
MNKSSIAILTTVVNFELYEKSSKLFPDDVQKYVIDGTNGMHGLDSIVYMMKKLKRREIKWLILADEDVVFKNTQSVFELINTMEKESFSFCGVRDGGHIPHRVQNPYLINTFFYILNFNEIETLWNINEIKDNNYIIENEFTDNLEKLKGKYDIRSLAEPYFCFFLWLRRKGKKVLFLESNLAFENDEFTNEVYFENQVILYHTWHARFYNNNEKHTKRIDAVFNRIKFPQIKATSPIIFKDSTYGYKRIVKKIYCKIKSKLT